MSGLVLWALLVSAPQGAQDPPARFTSAASLVVLHVSVVDGRSAFVPGLGRDQFLVYEDGKPQAITFFEHADTPVTAGLVIDSSISMHRIRKDVIEAAMRFADASHQNDELFTINFNERVWPGLPDGRPFTTDRAELKTALLKSGARGKTALFDALGTALEHVGRGTRQKKVLVVVSDGGDNASTRRFEDVLAAALRMNVVIYALSIEDQYNRDGNKGVLKKLAAATGGEAFFARAPEDASRVLERIAGDIRSGYTIGYVPPADQPSGYHEVKVRVVAPGRRLQARARSGYVAEGKAP